jgi:hypothetical protein
LIKIIKVDIFPICDPTTINMSLFTSLFRQTNTAVNEDTNIQDDMAEIEEEIEDSKQQFTIVTNEVAEAAKEALSKRTLTQYERYKSSCGAVKETLFRILMNLSVIGRTLSISLLETLVPTPLNDSTSRTMRCLA